MTKKNNLYIFLVSFIFILNLTSCKKSSEKFQIFNLILGENRNIVENKMLESGWKILRNNENEIVCEKENAIFEGLSIQNIQLNFSEENNLVQIFMNYNETEDSFFTILRMIEKNHFVNIFCMGPVVSEEYIHPYINQDKSVLLYDMPVLIPETWEPIEKDMGRNLLFCDFDWYLKEFYTSVYD